MPADGYVSYPDMDGLTTRDDVTSPAPSPEPQDVRAILEEMRDIRWSMAGKPLNDVDVNNWFNRRAADALTALAQSDAQPSPEPQDVRAEKLAKELAEWGFIARPAAASHKLHELIIAALAQSDAQRLMPNIHGIGPDTDEDAFPQPQRKDGGEPCGECHLQPGETCDICGAKRQSDAQPVAWLLKDTDGFTFTTADEPEARAYAQGHPRYSLFPLYTTPPRPDASDVQPVGFWRYKGEKLWHECNEAEYRLLGDNPEDVERRLLYARSGK